MLFHYFFLFFFAFEILKSNHQNYEAVCCFMIYFDEKHTEQQLSTIPILKCAADDFLLE
jgi:hypothetical protein